MLKVFNSCLYEWKVFVNVFVVGYVVIEYMFRNYKVILELLMLFLEILELEEKN